MAKTIQKDESESLLVPTHIGVIMDGNGRWAKKRLLPRKFGHREGAKTFKKIALAGKAMGVKYMTFYAFSTENWKRPKDEVDAIMKLFEDYLDDVSSFEKENIRLVFIGDRSVLSDNLQDKLKHAEEIPKDFDSMTVVLAVNYGGQSEICHSVKQIAQKVKNNEIEIDAINEKIIEENLYTGDIPPVDLIIRPSGEMRLSNFLIWQSAYAEYYFTDILWPDFKEKDLEKAIKAFCDRNRRFGGI